MNILAVLQKKLLEIIINKLNEYIDKSLLKIENDNVSEIYDDMLKRYTKLFEILSQ